jgi:hypothetical protein
VQVSSLHPLEYRVRCLTAVNNRAHDPDSLSEHFVEEWLSGLRQLI